MSYSRGYHLQSNKYLIQGDVVRSFDPKGCDKTLVSLYQGSELNVLLRV